MGAPNSLCIVVCHRWLSIFRLIPIICRGRFFQPELSLKFFGMYKCMQSFLFYSVERDSNHHHHDCPSPRYQIFFLFRESRFPSRSVQTQSNAKSENIFGAMMLLAWIHKTNYFKVKKWFFSSPPFGFFSCFGSLNFIVVVILFRQIVLCFLPWLWLSCLLRVSACSFPCRFSFRHYFCTFYSFRIYFLAIFLFAVPLDGLTTWVEIPKIYIYSRNIHDDEQRRQQQQQTHIK